MLFRSRRISRHGQTTRYFHTELGVNGRIDTLQAAIVLAKLDVFDDEVIARGQIGASLTSRLQASGIKSTPTISQGNNSVYAQYTIQVDNRADIQLALTKKGIPNAVHYPKLLSDQPALSSCSQHQETNTRGFPIAHEASQRVLSLPMHPYLSEADQDQITTAISEVVSV